MQYYVCTCTCVCVSIVYTVCGTSPIWNMYCLTPLLPPPPPRLVNVDMTRVLTSVLLQETQALDSKGEATIASTYTHWSVLGHTSHVTCCILDRCIRSPPPPLPSPLPLPLPPSRSLPPSTTNSTTSSSSSSSCSSSSSSSSSSSTSRYSQVLLKYVSLGNICYSRSRMAFVSRKALPFKAEEYSDVRGGCGPTTSLQACTCTCTHIVPLEFFLCQT